MKVKFIEYSGCFGIDLTAEDANDVIDLVRFGMNRTVEVRHVSVSVPHHDDGNPYASVVFGKLKDPSNQVARAK